MHGLLKNWGWSDSRQYSQKLINMFLLGYVAQFFHGLLLRLCPDPSIALRIAVMPAALAGLCVSGSLYMTADLGVSTYDAVALVISNTWHKMEFRFCRILTDLVCVLLGSALFLLSGRTFRTEGKKQLLIQNDYIG